MKYLKEYSEVVHDPISTSDVFTIKLRSLQDLSNPSNGNHSTKPIDDFLDTYQEGNRVRGVDREGKSHEGDIVFIKRDGEGDGIQVKVMSDGRIVELMPMSLKMVHDNGNTNIKFAADNRSMMVYSDNVNECKIKRFNDI